MRKLIVSLTLLFCSFMFISEADAQSRVVTGVITDCKTGQVLPGVSVTIFGTSTGTTTDSDGRFSLRCPAGATHLVAKIVGFLVLNFGPTSSGTEASVCLQPSSDEFTYNLTNKYDSRESLLKKKGNFIAQSK